MKTKLLVFSIAFALLVLPAAAQRGGRASQGGHSGNTGMRSGRLDSLPGMPTVMPGENRNGPRVSRSETPAPKVRTRQEVTHRERVDAAGKSQQESRSKQIQVQERTRRESSQPDNPDEAYRNGPNPNDGTNHNRSAQRAASRTQSKDRP